MSTIEVASRTLTVDGVLDAETMSVVRAMLAAAVESRGPCVLTPECNGGSDVIEVETPTGVAARVYL